MLFVFNFAALQTEFEPASNIMLVGTQLGGLFSRHAKPLSNNICAVLAFENSMVNIEFWGSRLHRRAARIIPDEHAHTLHSSTQRGIPLWLSVIWRAFCNVAVHLHDTNFLQYSRRVLLWCDDIYLWRFNCTWATPLLNVRLGLCRLAATGHHAMSTSWPKKDRNFAFWPSQWRHSAT